MADRRAAHADSRPRVHVWAAQDGSVEWSIGPVGIRCRSPSPGGAVDSALVLLGCQPAVIIFEGQV